MSRGRSCAVFFLMTMAGCGTSNAPLPSESEAKAALTSALDTWKSGKPVAELATAKPPVQAVDADWVAGRILESYTIGDGSSGGEGNKTFSVTLKIKGSNAPSTVKYMIFGKDPVRVYRDLDFERMSNMENNPTPEKPKR